jgi:formamidopyrimidine-DNA glycosylase
MPELPEVETIVRDIRPALLGRRLDRVRLSHDDVLRGVTRRRLLRQLPAPRSARCSAAPSTRCSTWERRLVVQA